MREHEQSELLSRLLKLLAEEDVISTLNESLSQNPFPQPWQCVSDEALSETIGRLKQFVCENPSLQHLTQPILLCYTEYQKKRLTSEIDKISCLKPRTSMFIPGRGWYYLSDLPDVETGKTINQSVTDNIIISTGTSKITFCGGIHFKFNPKKPGIEYAIHALDSLLFPDQAVTNPSLFIKIRLPDDVVEEVLATQTVYGKTADKFPEEHLRFEQKHFTQQCLLQLLTAPGDGKLDNFIISQNQLIGIDNEMAFEPEILKGVGRKGHVTYIHIFLFFLPQMKADLNPEIIESFKTLCVEKLFLLWLKELEARNSLYDRLSRPHLKIVFDQGALKAVYLRLKKIQLFFRETPLEQITGESLFKAVMPEVFSYYQAINRQLAHQPLQKKIEALQKAKTTNHEEILSFEKLGLPLPPIEKIITEESMEETKLHRRGMTVSKEAILIPEESPKDAIQSLFMWIDRSNLTPKEQEDFDNEFRAGILPTQELGYRDETLTGEKLLTFTRNATISYLYLEKTQVKLNDLKKLLSFQGCIGIEICLGENPCLGLEAWQYLLHSPLCLHFSLKLPQSEILCLKGKNTSTQIQILPSSYLHILSQQKRNSENKGYLQSIETLLIQESYPLKSFEVCLAQQDDPNARRLIVSSLRYLIVMLENKQATPEQYLTYYLKLNKPWRQVFYQQVLQEIVNPERRQRIQHLIGDYPDSDGERRLNAIKEQQFRQQLTNLTEKESKIFLPEEKVCIESLTIGKAFLSKNLIRKLINEGWLLDENFNFKRKKEKQNIDKTGSSVLHGNHLVIPINHNGSQLHCKVLPDFPGMEIAYSLLSQRIMGKGSPQIELWKWTYGQQAYPVLVSETIFGENLTAELLQKFPLEPLSYQQLVLMAMLVNPGDGNPGNFIAQKIKASDASIQLRLISIDNDRLFAPPFETGKLRASTIIYCFNEMQLPLHKDLRQQFLSLNAYEILDKWLNDLERLNQQYCDIFTPKELEQFMSGMGEANQTSYLLTMLKRQTVAELFRKIKTAQYWLSVQPQISLIDLLSKVQPSLANHYQQMRLQYDEPIKRFEEAVKNEYKREEIQGVKRYTSTMHMGQYLKMQGREITSDKTVASYWQQDFVQAKKELRELSISREAIELAKLQLIQGNSKGFEDLPEAYAQEEVIASINFDREIRNTQGLPDAKRQQDILLLVINSKGLKPLERLVIQHCAITDGQLEQFLKRLPKLRTLNLTNCPSINMIFYQTVFKKKIRMNTLEECILQDMPGLINFNLTIHTLHYLSIKQAPHLKTFYFYSNTVTQLRLSNAPQCNQFDIYAKELKEADFSGNVLLTDLHLQQIVLRCQNLKQMNLQRCDEKKIHYRALKEMLPVFSEKITNNEEDNLLDATAGELSLIAGNQMEELNIKDKKNISGWIWKCFCVALAENVSVKKISTDYLSGLNDEDAIQLAKALEHNQTLAHINLEFSSIGDKGAIGLAKALEYNQTLTNIDFMGSSIGDEGAIALAKALEHNQTLTKILLMFDSIGDKGAIAFAKALEHNQTLTDIGLISNTGDKGAIAFAKALEHNQTLTNIGLGDNIGDKGAIAFAKALEHNQALIEIALIGNIGDEGAIALAKALEHNKTLKSIGVGLIGGNIGDKGAIAFAKVLEYNQTLTNIDFMGNRIGDKGAIALFNMLQKNKTIEKVTIDEDRITPEIKIAINKEGGSRLIFKDSTGSERTLLLAYKFGLLNIGMGAMKKLASLIATNFSSEGAYIPHHFLLNPFTFFSEHADRENALFFAQNHQQQLLLCLEKSLAVWEIPKGNENSKKKDEELQKVAQCFGFKCINTAKNGNCLFEAISNQLRLIFRHEKTYHYTPAKLRELAVAYLMKHQDFYENFVEDHNFASFIHKMSLSGTWAEHTVLNALANMLNITVVVINSDNSPPIILKKSHAQGIIYLGYEVNAHYQLLTRDLSIMPEKNIQSYIDHSNFIEEPKEASVEQLRVGVRK